MLKQNQSDIISDSTIPVDQEGRRNPAQSQAYGDFIVKHLQDVQHFFSSVSKVGFQRINEVFGVAYVPMGQLPEMEINSYSYNSIPKCYTCMDLDALQASGVTGIQDHPYLQLRGKGTAVAIIDTGIDFKNQVFRNENGKSRIGFLWDQTIEGRDKNVPYGKLFTGQEIDRALESEHPYELVPSRDTSGHGTMLAGIAAGGEKLSENFSGAAPESELFVVKLKPAKEYLRRLYLYPESVEMFQENDIMMGIHFAVSMAKKKGLALSICLGTGTSQGAHLGESPLCQYLRHISELSHVFVCAPAGNEGTARHHFYGKLNGEKQEERAELRVEEKQGDFSMEMWGRAEEKYEIFLQSPSGERLEVSTSMGEKEQTLSFVFVETKVQVNYISLERQTGYTLVYFRFFHPAPGIWKIYVKGQREQSSIFHIWLPVQGLISKETCFLEASPDNTVTSPGDAENSTTVTAYDWRDQSLYLEAGRGFLTEDKIAPHLAAPGVKIQAVFPGNRYGQVSGTSAAAAQVSGIGALLLEWAVVRGNMPYCTGKNIRHCLQRGAERERSLQYPSREWGYGRVDLYQAFQMLQ